MARRIRTILVATAALCALAAVAPAAQAHERPFKLVEHGTAVFDGTHVSSVGHGHATHIGCFMLTREADLSNPHDGVFDVTGSATITAANGDRLFASITGTLDTNTSTGVLFYEWEGGTGRFRHATGATTWNVEVYADGTYDVTATGVIDF